MRTLISWLGIGSTSVFRIFHGLRPERERETKYGAAVRAILRPDAPSMGLDHSAADRQAEADSSLPGRSRSVELVKDQLLFALRYSRPAIRDLEENGPIDLGSGEVDRALRRGVFQGILEQVDQDLLYQNAVDQDRRELRRKVGRYRTGLQSCLDPLERGCGHLLQGVSLLLEADRPGLQAGHVEQVFDLEIQPARFIKDGANQFLARCGADDVLRFQQAARGARDRGQRGPQIVGNRAQNHVAHSLGFSLHLRGLRVTGEQGAFDCESKLAGEGL